MVPPFAQLRSSALALTIANLVPLFGVLALGWRGGALIVFYWAETLVIGFFAVLKMLRA